MNIIIDKQKDRAVCNPTQLSDLDQLKKIKEKTIIVNLNEIDDIEFHYYYKSFKGVIIGCAISLEKENDKNIIFWDKNGFMAGALGLLKGEAK